MKIIKGLKNSSPGWDDLKLEVIKSVPNVIILYNNITKMPIILTEVLEYD